MGLRFRLGGNGAQFSAALPVQDLKCVMGADLPVIEIERLHRGAQFYQAMLQRSWG